jgi:GST-like protein
MMQACIVGHARCVPTSTGPIAGATHDAALPVGKHPLQLYSLATPNGVKVTVMLEELLALGHTGAEYDAWLINILEGPSSAAASSRSTPTPRSRR